LPLHKAKGFRDKQKGFYLGTILGVGQFSLGFILGSLDQIESFGHKKRFGTRVELGLKINSCNPVGNLV
jgi:hypothetical protein